MIGIKDIFQGNRKLLPSTLLLILVNLIPLYAVVFLGWNTFLVIFLFWLENVIIGFFNILRMLFSQPHKVANWVAKLFLVPFFTFHYGMFTAVHGVFVISMFGKMSNLQSGLPDLELISSLIYGHNLGFAALAIFISHGFSMFYNYILREEYRTASLKDLMIKPYGRIVVLHLAIIFGGFLVLALRLEVAGMILLVLLKILLDLRAHIREHRHNSASNSPSPVSDPAGRKLH